tara:strand:+ start:110 stop:742 length:633 start_codon:yes stop_codon:yes gene_type:complete
VIVLRAKKVEFDVTHITADNKPEWFLEISPHGKVPLLMVDQEVLFESNAIVEFLDETIKPRLHPEDPFKRAENRAWTDFVPSFATALNLYMYAANLEDQQSKKQGAQNVLLRLEERLEKDSGKKGTYFNGKDLSIVDAAYAPFFMRFTIVEPYCKTGIMEGFPYVEEWRKTLIKNPLVKDSLPGNFMELFKKNLVKRGAYFANEFLIQPN